MDTDNQANSQSQDVTAQEEPKAPKTFTQEQVNTIVANRVADFSDYEELKAKAAKYDEAEEANKSELQKAQDKAASLQKEIDELRTQEKVRTVRETVSNATGIPADLLHGTTEEECQAEADKIKAFAKPDYPNVKDGGEPSGQGKLDTRSQFAEWFEKQ